MITIKNYYTETDSLDLSSWPDELKEGHEFFNSVIGGGNGFTFYESSPKIKETIDLYIAKLNEYLATTRAANKTKKTPGVEKKSARPSSGGGEKGKVEKSTKSSKKMRPITTVVKQVEAVREEVKFIRRFVALHNKKKPARSILSLIRGLQRAIVQKLMRKTSPLADVIRDIQDRLVGAYNRNNAKEIRIVINRDELARYVEIAGGEQVYPSINIIKRYIGLQGKVLDSDKLESFAKQIKNAISKGKVKQEDPYLDKVNAVLASIRKLKGGDELNIGKAELNGLSGIGTNCGCQKANTSGRRNFEAAKARTSRKRNGELGELPVRTRGGVLSAEQMANRKFDSIQLSPTYLQLIGKPAKNFSMMIHGEPGAGKTSFLLTFAKYLAENCGRVLFVTSEEFDASTMTDKINRYVNPKPAGLFFSPSLYEVDLSPYAFVVLDSVNSLGLKLPDFKALQAEYRGVAFILVLQHTKSGEYRGGKDWEHETEIAANVENGNISVDRNRYGVNGSMKIF